ncbi:MAG: hypothetical protein ACJAY8_000610 [Sphingobacteriales bacterium]|jgi:hypothetical protein
MPKAQNVMIKSRIVALRKFSSHLVANKAEVLAAIKSISSSAKALNQWFVWEEIELAFEGISRWFTESALSELQNAIEKLDQNQNKGKTLGVICAGNIPWVGLHDIFMAFAAGWKVNAKLSSQDRILMSWFLHYFHEVTGEKMGEIVERMKDVDAVIATGSGNTARYFESYFGKYPNIIRKNRTSVAVLNGQETKEDFLGLAEDIFRFYGLGCRNVNHLFLPVGSSLDHMFEAFFHKGPALMAHNKYMNNYEYHRAVFLLEKIPFLENNFVIMRESDQLASPVGVIHYSFYGNEEELKAKLAEAEGQIQCIVGADYLPFGQAQKPGILDFADGVNTLEFLLEV